MEEGKYIYSKKTILTLGQKTFCVCLLVFIFAICLSAKANATTYYVDNSCSNNGDGTAQTCAAGSGQAGPFNAIMNMLTRAGGYSAGDNIYFKAGQTYSDTQLYPQWSGSSGSPITFGAYGVGAKPIINPSTDPGTEIRSTYDYIVLDGLDLRSSTGAGVRIYGSPGGNFHLTIQNSNISGTYGIQNAGAGGAYTLNLTTSNVVVAGSTQPAWSGFADLTLTGTMTSTTFTSSASNGFSAIGNLVNQTFNTCSFTNSALVGFVSNGGVNSNVSFVSPTVTGNQRTGMSFDMGNGESMTGLTIDDGTISNNGSAANYNGLEFIQSGTGSFSTIVAKNITITGNTNNGVNLSGGATGITVEKNEIYDNDTTQLNIADTSSLVATRNIVYTTAGQTTTGLVTVQEGSSLNLYNNVVKADSVSNDGLTLDSTGSAGTFNLKNNIFYGGRYGVKDEADNAPTFAEDYNNYYGQGTGSVLGFTIGSHSILTDPVFTSSSNFHLQATSSAIDSGTNVSLTTDYEGNPLYGLPDIGAYEYQPTKEIDTDSVYKDADITVYGNEKFRNRASESGGVIDFLLSIPGSTRTEYINVNVTTWANTGTRQKTWTEDSTVSALTNTIHTIGDLEASTYYNVTVDDGITNLTGTDCSTIGSNFVCFSDAEGRIVFTYTGTYSTHEFNVEEGNNAGPLTTASPEGDTYDSAQTVTLTCDDNDGVSCNKTYYTLDGTTPTTSSTEYTAPITISTDTTLKFFSTDINGESELAKTEIYVFEDEDEDHDDLDISKIRYEIIPNNQLKITFKTSNNSRASIRYGLDRNLKEKEKEKKKTKRHSVVLKNLIPGATYYFRIKVEDSFNQTDRSKIRVVVLPKKVAATTSR